MVSHGPIDNADAGLLVEHDFYFSALGFGQADTVHPAFEREVCRSSINSYTRNKWLLAKVQIDSVTATIHSGVYFIRLMLLMQMAIKSYLKSVHKGTPYDDATCYSVIRDLVRSVYYQRGVNGAWKLRFQVREPWFRILSAIILENCPGSKVVNWEQPRCAQWLACQSSIGDDLFFMQDNLKAWLVCEPVGFWKFIQFLTPWPNKRASITSWLMVVTNARKTRWDGGRSSVLVFKGTLDMIDYYTLSALKLISILGSKLDAYNSVVRLIGKNCCMIKAIGSNGIPYEIPFDASPFIRPYVVDRWMEDFFGPNTKTKFEVQEYIPNIDYMLRLSCEGKVALCYLIFPASKVLQHCNYFDMYPYLANWCWSGKAPNDNEDFEIYPVNDKSGATVFPYQAILNKGSAYQMMQNMSTYNELENNWRKLDKAGKLRTEWGMSYVSAFGDLNRIIVTDIIPVKLENVIKARLVGKPALGQNLSYLVSEHFESTWSKEEEEEVRGKHQKKGSRPVKRGYVQKDTVYPPWGKISSEADHYLISKGRSPLLSKRMKKMDLGEMDATFSLTMREQAKKEKEYLDMLEVAEELGYLDSAVTDEDLTDSLIEYEECYSFVLSKENLVFCTTDDTEATMEDSDDK